MEVMNQLPEINKTYYCYSDGKIKLSRQCQVQLIELIPFDKINQEILEFWKEEIKEIDWLFAEKTDYFIKGLIDDGFGKMEEVYFVRANEGWYSIAYNDFNLRLDYNNELTNWLNNERNNS